MRVRGRKGSVSKGVQMSNVSSPASAEVHDRGPAPSAYARPLQGPSAAGRHVEKPMIGFRSTLGEQSRRQQVEKPLAPYPPRAHTRWRAPCRPARRSRGRRRGPSLPARWPRAGGRSRWAGRPAQRSHRRRMSRPRLTRCASGALAVPRPPPGSPRHQWREGRVRGHRHSVSARLGLVPLYARSMTRPPGHPALALLAPRSSPRCRHSRWSTAPSTSARVSRTPTACRLFSMRPRRPSTPAAISTHPAPASLNCSTRLRCTRNALRAGRGRSVRGPRHRERPRRPSRRSRALVQPGDEVVTFEPYFTTLVCRVDRARGGVRRTVPLRFPEWSFDEGSPAHGLQ